MFLHFALSICQTILRGYELFVEFLQNFSPRSIECTNLHARAKCPILGDLQAEHLTVTLVHHLETERIR